MQDLERNFQIEALGQSFMFDLAAQALINLRLQDAADLAREVVDPTPETTVTEVKPK